MKIARNRLSQVSSRCLKGSFNKADPIIAGYKQEQGTAGAIGGAADENSAQASLPFKSDSGVRQIFIRRDAWVSQQME